VKKTTDEEVMAPMTEIQEATAPTAEDQEAKAPTTENQGVKASAAADKGVKAPTNVEPKPLNRFNIESLRLSQDFSENLGVKKLLTTVPVRKPTRQEWVRVCPNPAYRLEPAALLELKEDREHYLVMPGLTGELLGEFSPAGLYLSVTRQNAYFLWPAKFPGIDGKDNEWNRSSREAVDRATQGWLRVASNMAISAYEMYEASGEIPEPAWPEIPFEDILQIAFRGHVIDTPDHSVILRLRGAA
jgi:hypothetical protein